MPKTKDLTHPDTNETLSLSGWGRKLGIHTSSVSNRLKRYGDLRIVLSKGRMTTGKRRWTKEEDDLIKKLFFLPNFLEEYRKQSKLLNHQLRTDRAIFARVSVLQRRHELSIKRGNLEACVEAGVVNVAQLATCLNISPVTVQRFCDVGGLKYTISPQTHHHCIELRLFAVWATSDIGSRMLAKAIKQDAPAIAWVLEIMGLWFSRSSKYSVTWRIGADPDSLD